MKKVIVNGKEIKTNLGQRYYHKTDWDNNTDYVHAEVKVKNNEYDGYETAQELFDRCAKYGYSKIMIYTDKFTYYALCQR